MSYETLRLIRNLFLRSFVIGIVITLILAAATLCLWDMWMPMATTWFHADAATLTPIVLKFFVNIRFFLLYIVLMPALALHWTLKRDFGKKSK